MKISQKGLTLIVCTSLNILFLGCGNRYTSEFSSSKERDNKDNPEIRPNNVMKVLNRVECAYSYCEQVTLNAIWKTCINNGYQTEMPTGVIWNARDIRELVSGTEVRMKTETTTVQQSDSNGIVTDVETTPVEKPYTVEYKGYCIGSEYLSQN